MKYAIFFSLIFLMFSVSAVAAQCVDSDVGEGDPLLVAGNSTFEESVVLDSCENPLRIKEAVCTGELAEFEIKDCPAEHYCVKTDSDMAKCVPIDEARVLNVTVEVFDERGAAVQGAKVYAIVYFDEIENGAELPLGMTDANGRSQVQYIPTGAHYTIFIEKTGYQKFSKEFEVILTEVQTSGVAVHRETIKGGSSPDGSEFITEAAFKVGEDCKSEDLTESRKLTVGENDYYVCFAANDLPSDGKFVTQAYLDANNCQHGGTENGNVTFSEDGSSRQLCRTQATFGDQRFLDLFMVIGTDCAKMGFEEYELQSTITDISGSKVSLCAKVDSTPFGVDPEDEGFSGCYVEGETLGENGILGYNLSVVQNVFSQKPLLGKDSFGFNRDYCLNESTLVEYYCKAVGDRLELADNEESCAYGCWQGRCLGEGETSSEGLRDMPFCFDADLTDSLKNFKASFVDLYQGNGVGSRLMDSCQDTELLVEQACGAGVTGTLADLALNPPVVCEFGCENGQCKNESAPEPEEPEEPVEVTPEPGEMCSRESFSGGKTPDQACKDQFGEEARCNPDERPKLVGIWSVVLMWNWFDGWGSFGCDSVANADMRVTCCYPESWEENAEVGEGEGELLCAPNEIVCNPVDSPNFKMCSQDGKSWTELSCAGGSVCRDGNDGIKCYAP